MQNHTISFQTTNIIGGAEIQVIHVCIVTPARRLTPSDRKVLSIQLLKYFIPCISFNGLFLFKEEEDEVDKQTYTPRNRGDGQ